MPFLAQQSTTKSPSTSTCYPSVKELDCDFDVDCAWRNAQYNAFDWSIVDVNTGNKAFGGPLKNHKSETSGLYLIANTTTVRTKSASASYESPIMNGVKCVEFWYYLNGPEVFEIIRRLLTLTDWFTLTSFQVGSLSLIRRADPSKSETKVFFPIKICFINVIDRSSLVNDLFQISQGLDKN